MNLIVCATGNAGASRLVQNRAVEIAAKQKKRLVFVHVVDLSRLGSIDQALLPAAEHELAWLGEAILRLAQERAQRLGVQAEIAILRGPVRDALEAFIHERGADLLLLGQPTDEALRQFANQIERDTGVPVMLVTGS